MRWILPLVIALGLLGTGHAEPSRGELMERASVATGSSRRSLEAIEKLATVPGSDVYVLLRRLSQDLSSKVRETARKALVRRKAAGLEMSVKRRPLVEAPPQPVLREVPRRVRGGGAVWGAEPALAPRGMTVSRSRKPGGAVVQEVKAAPAQAAAAPAAPEAVPEKPSRQIYIPGRTPLDQAPENLRLSPWAQPRKRLADWKGGGARGVGDLSSKSRPKPIHRGYYRKPEPAAKGAPGAAPAGPGAGGFTPQELQRMQQDVQKRFREVQGALKGSSSGSRSSSSSRSRSRSRSRSGSGSSSRSRSGSSRSHR